MRVSQAAFGCSPCLKEERKVKKFLYLTYGFEKPTPEIMNAWKAWFAEIGEHIVEQAHLPRGAEITEEGQRELPLDLEAITGYMVVKAESFEEAVKLAESNPFITGIRIYEVASG